MGRLALRHAARAWAHSPNTIASPTPFSIFGASLVHEWDFALSTITIATGISSISDLRGGKDLTQATGANQPAYTAAGLQSYATGDGVNDALSNATMSLSGDITFLCIGKPVVVALTAAGHNFIHAGVGIGLLQWFSNANFRGAITDSTGQDVITGAAADTNLHAFAMRNATAVARKHYVDGGAGTAGVRTAAMSSATVCSLFSNNAGSGFANARIYWAGIVATSPTLANLNLWGAWAASRFGITWTTAT